MYTLSVDKVHGKIRRRPCEKKGSARKLARFFVQFCVYIAI